MLLSTHIRLKALHTLIMYFEIVFTKCRGTQRESTFMYTSQALISLIDTTLSLFYQLIENHAEL